MKHHFLLVVLSMVFNNIVLAQNITIDEHAKTNTYKSDVPLFGQLFEYQMQLSETRVSQKGAYTVKEVEFEIGHSLGTIFLLSDLEMGESDFISIKTELGLQRVFYPNEISLQGNLNTGLIVGQRIVMYFHQNSDVSLPTLRGAYLFSDEDFYSYSQLDNTSEKDFGESDVCNIYSACPEGDDTRLESKGFARITLVVEEGTGWCSGALLNNEREDFTPYFLTAYHCQDGFTPLFEFWRFDFHYELDECRISLNEPTPDRLTGCSYRAGRQESDFMLLEFTRSVPVSYDVYYNGWNNQDIAPSEMTCLHHPRGDVKRVTLYASNQTFSNPDPINWNNSVTTPANHHWLGPHSAGMIQVGSSGAPVLNQNNLVVGQLHGGNVECESGFGVYGKFSRSWDEGQSRDTRLREWLIPSGNNINQLGGLDGALSYCEGQREYNTPTGSFTDGSEADMYLENTDCQYLISIPNTAETIELSFDYLALHESDTLYIYDGSDFTAPLIGKYTHSIVSNDTLYSSGSEMLLHFVADDKDQLFGFRANYRNLAFESNIEIKGRVFLPQLNPAGVVIMAENSRGEIIARDTTDSSGSYSFQLPNTSERHVIQIHHVPYDPSGLRASLLPIYYQYLVLGEPFDFVKGVVMDLNSDYKVDMQDIYYLRSRILNTDLILPNPHWFAYTTPTTVLPDLYSSDIFKEDYFSYELIPADLQQNERSDYDFRIYMKGYGN